MTMTAPEEEVVEVRARDWRVLLREHADRNGKPFLDEHNVFTVLENDPNLGGAFSYNEFTLQLIANRPIKRGSTEGYPRPLNESDEIELTIYVQETALPNVSRERVSNALRHFAMKRCAFNPRRDYFDSLLWDGGPRVSHWLIDYLGADQQPEHYVIACGRSMLISAVARVFRPGCQVDTMVVLEGPQGLGKSSVLRILYEPYLSQSMPHDLSSKDAMSHLRGLHCAEWAELSQLNRTRREQLKAFISASVDRYRPPYGRIECDVPRTCVFVGTTNDAEYLVDETGNRRFLPVRCSKIDLAALTRDRDQLWAEAVHLYREGAAWHLTGELAIEAESQAKERMVSDPFCAFVISAAREYFGRYGAKRTVSPAEIYKELRGEADPLRCTSETGRRIAAALLGEGFTRCGKSGSRGVLFAPPEGWK